MDNRFFFTMSQIQSRIRLYYDNAIRSHGLTISTGQAGVLFLLEQTNNRPMGELGTILSIDNSTITRMIDRLEKQELVERLLNPSDRRQFLIGITEKGRDQIGQVKIIVDEMNRKMTEDLTEAEISTFRKILGSLGAKFG